MTGHLRRAALASGAGAGLALLAAFGLAGHRLFAAAHGILEIFTGDRGDPISMPDLGALALLGLALALGIGALALWIAARRAALTLERASLVDGSH